MVAARGSCSVLFAIVLAAPPVGALAEDADDLSLLQTYVRTAVAANRSSEVVKRARDSLADHAGNGNHSGNGSTALAASVPHAAARTATWRVRSPEHRKSNLGIGEQGVRQPGFVEHLIHSATALNGGRLPPAGLLQWVSGSALMLLGIAALWQIGIAGNLWQDLQRESVLRPYSALILEAVPKAQFAARVSVYGTLYILLSVAFISYNRFLVSEGRFPFAANLAFGHQVCGSLFLLVLYKACPFLYPSLVEPEKRANCLTCRFVLRGSLPIAVCFSMQLVLSNCAYLYASVSFLQMMKEGNMVVVYCLSLLAGLERFHGIQAAVLLCLLTSTLLTIEGQLYVSVRALCVQGGSQLLEATKIVAQSSLLSAAGSARLDAMSYNLLVQPLSAAGLLVFLLVCMAFVPGVATATWADYAAWWPHLVGNACVALALNIAVALFISKTSAVGFIVVGIVKDIVLVVSDVLLQGTHISSFQTAAFVLQILFVAHYSFFKTFSKQWENLHRWSRPKQLS